MIVCTNNIPLKRYQIFQKYKYLINVDLKGQSAYSSVTSVSLLAGEVQVREIARGKLSLVLGKLEGIYTKFMFA